jgi:hypothetical protein
VEHDRVSVVDRPSPSGDRFGARNTERAPTCVQHESGEIELYDLHVDPFQPANQGADPAWAATRDGLGNLPQ